MKPPMYEIEIANEQTCLPIDEPLLINVVRYTLEQECATGAQISLALVDDETIWDLNRRYLQHDYPTDVLSFLLESDRDEDADVAELDVPRGSGCWLSGEIIVGVEMAVRMAADYDWRPQDEVLLYVVHGLLHLCGYDDLTSAEQAVMRDREREILKHWNLVPHYLESAKNSVESVDQSAGAESP